MMKLTAIQKHLKAAVITHPHSHIPSVCPQVTQKAGRTSLSPETLTTWWEPTVCLCSLTTFKGWTNGCDVTECGTMEDTNEEDGLA